MITTIHPIQLQPLLRLLLRLLSRRSQFEQSTCPSQSNDRVVRNRSSHNPPVRHRIYHTLQKATTTATTTTVMATVKITTAVFSVKRQQQCPLQYWSKILIQHDLTLSATFPKHRCCCCYRCCCRRRVLVDVVVLWYLVLLYCVLLRSNPAPESFVDC